ncbi:hypothetical protein IKW75_01335 [Candidatus Saccharibacteria bacterium]|nr:hypothetical protein [Candidatus Saccharibacteria bacterium]
MAKEVAISKRVKISEAEQYMLLAVGGAALFLGVAIAVVVNFIHVISFNANVISEADKSIEKYSTTIRDIGICPAPKGSVYTIEELQACNPNTVSISEVPGSLRSNIVENLANNDALNSVPKEDSSLCLNSATGKNYTYSELNKLYNNAKNSEELVAASVLLRSCSALRIIPDALPAYKNEEALLSSLNKIFNISGWEPDNLSPDSSSQLLDYGTNLNSLTVRLSIEGVSSFVTMKVINNIETSIRDFNFTTATIKWDKGNLDLQAQANAFYMDKTTLSESTKTIAGDKKE